MEAVIQGTLSISDKDLQKNVKTVMTPITNLQGQKVGFLKADIRSTMKRDSIFNSSQVISQNYKTTNNLPINTDPQSLQVSVDIKKQP